MNHFWFRHTLFIKKGFLKIHFNKPPLTQQTPKNPFGFSIIHPVFKKPLQTIFFCVYLSSLCCYHGVYTWSLGKGQKPERVGYSCSLMLGVFLMFYLTVKELTEVTKLLMV